MPRVKQLKQGLATILTVSEALIGDLSQELQENIRTCLDAGDLHLLVDCHQVTAFDSTALETLLSCSRLARRKGGTIKLVHLNEVCRDILVATRIEPFLEVYADIPQALQSCL
jgi:anti-sigma B factor antagonist